MTFFQKLIGQSTEPPKTKNVDRNHILPSNIVVKEFGKVNVLRKAESLEIMFTILMETIGEGWQTGVAIDASASMLDTFGRGLRQGPKGPPPQSLLNEYHNKGWTRVEEHKGKKWLNYSKEAKCDLVNRGYCVWSENEIQPLARRITAYLASKLDVDGGTTVIYWACGDGKQLEVVGDLTVDDCEKANFTGPTKVEFGASTHLTPVMQYFVDRFIDAPMGMYTFITDGKLHDLEDVKKFTIKLCQDIQSGKRKPIKCVLIGIGDQVDEGQMEELDDLESGTNVDIWDHKIAKDMRNLVEIFAEIVDDNQIVAQSGRIYDASGKIVKEFRDGLPARIKFSMPASSQWFTLEVPDQPLIRQIVTVPT